MGGETQETQTEAVLKAHGFVVERMKAGADKDTIRAGLEQTGMNADEARNLVDTMYPEIMRLAKAQEFTTDVLPPAIIAGVLAALVGGAVWGAIVIYTGYEVGFVAWGIGFIAGLAVVRMARDRRGLPLQLVAVASSLAGIAVGKYVAYFHFLKEAVAEEYGPEAAQELSMLSGDVFRYFMDNAQSMFGGYDILWVVFAVVTAWRIPQGMGIKVPAHVHP